ncbi:MAG: HAD family hydrolase, partial [Sarcina sp.]
GTLIKRSINIDFLLWLYNKKVISGCHEITEWKDKYRDTEFMLKMVNILHKELAGVPYQQLVKLASIFIKDYKSWCDLTKAFEVIDPKNTIVISGSPDFLVKAFCKEFGIKDGYGELFYLDDKGCNTGIRMKTYVAHSKSIVIESLIDCGHIIEGDYIVGLGDTRHDKGIFDYTDEAYLVDPSEETKVWYEEQCSYWKDIKTI